MNMRRFVRSWVLALMVACGAAGAAHASDHADPMSLNVLEFPKSPEANITDLHAFVTDGANPHAKLDGTSDDEGKRLVVSLCVRRALMPEDGPKLSLDEYRFKVHLDLGPSVRFLSPDATSTESGSTLADLHRDISMQRLYGGIITNPDDIVDDVVLEFALKIGDVPPEGQPRIDVTLVPSGVPDRWQPFGVDSPPALPAHRVAVAAGVFDDPFIFPRFFRRNVVGVVTSIPISMLRLPHRPPGETQPILLWATTHKDGTQIDHVGRSLRTQLPRFGELNDKPPSEHVRAIIRKHDDPNLMEAVTGTFVAPLLAHRHYDVAPDVMIYDLRKEARFPNGRWLEDDVSATLAEAGETLLFELSYAESRQVPRATTNDKPFRTSSFPYLAEPWDPVAIEKAATDGVTPLAADRAAIAFPTFDDSIWRMTAMAVGAAILVLTLGLILTLRPRWLKVVLAIAALVLLVRLHAVYAANIPGDMMQPGMKLARTLWGLVAALLLLVGFIFTLGRRSVKRLPDTTVFPSGPQEATADDARRTSYDGIHRALFDPAHNRGYYSVWGICHQEQLPVYRTTFASITADAIRTGSKEFAMVRASRRSLKTSGDLRWGSDGQGFRRLVHPMGVCLAGTWEIDPAATVDYTGYFAPGKRGRVIARYSLGGNEPRGGHHRSLGLAGKVFADPADVTPDQPDRGHFITQDDLGGTLTTSVTQVELTNSPPVTLLNRGAGLFAFLPVIFALAKSDKQPAERQLYEIAELGKDPGVTTRCPRFMRLTIQGPRRDGGTHLDFRDEILGMIYDRGDSTPRRPLVFTIEVSDKGRRTLFQKVRIPNWTKIGSITFTEAAASYNGDFVVHFHHPPWRLNVNDPKTVARPYLRS